jgi:hypothetical protein
MRFTTLLFALLVACLSLPTKAQAAVAPTCSLTTPSQLSKVPSPAALILTYSSSNAATCTATSTGNQTAWTGSKPLSGGQTLTGIKASADYAYTCSSAVASTGSASLSWTPPTQNSDGSALTDLAGTNLYWGSSASTLTNKIPVTDPAKTAYQVDTLPVGLIYFGAKAYNAAGVESAFSTIVSKAIIAQAPLTCSQTIHIDVVTVPNPPTNLTVTDPSAFEFKTDSSGALVAHLIGRIPVGTVCSERMQKVGAISYGAVDMTSVDLFVKPVSLADSQAWAKCG